MGPKQKSQSTRLMRKCAYSQAKFFANAVLIFSRFKLSSQCVNRQSHPLVKLLVYPSDMIDTLVLVEYGEYYVFYPLCLLFVEFYYK